MRDLWDRLTGRLLLSIRSRGLPNAFFRAVRLARVYSAQRVRKTLHKREYRRELQELEARISQPCPFIDLLHIPMGWNTELFQRFQHLSLQASKLGGLALYGGHPSVDGGLFVYREPRKNLCVFDATNREVTSCVMQTAARHSRPRILRIQSIDLSTSYEEICDYIQQAFIVVYEYIDAITPEIIGNVPDLVYRRHLALLNDDRVIVAVTSDQLLDEVRRVRSERVLLSTNGVDLDHWRVPRGDPPRDLRPALSGKQVVGYHGAIARWIDFELLRLIADDGGYEVVLIGREHDQEFRKSGLGKHPRVHFLGSKSYFELNSYAAYYDIGILPFQKSKLTDSVSPLKIFEYMAASKPIVAYDLRECSKYRSCLTAEDRQEFMANLQLAVRLKDDAAYLELLGAEARQNSWQTKMTDLLRFAKVRI